MAQLGNGSEKQSLIHLTSLAQSIVDLSWGY